MNILGYPWLIKIKLLAVVLIYVGPVRAQNSEGGNLSSNIVGSYLLESFSTIANSMGGLGAAVHTESDLMSLHRNPGNFLVGDGFGLSFQFQPDVSSNGLGLGATEMRGGIATQGRFPINNSGITLHLGYSEIHKIITNKIYPTGDVTADLRAKTTNIGIALHRNTRIPIDVSIGISRKLATEALAAPSLDLSSSNVLYGYGIVLRIPYTRYIGSNSVKSLHANLSIGLSRQNLGDRMNTINNDITGAPPSRAISGYSISLGWLHDSFSNSLILIQAGREVDDIIIEGNESGLGSYNVQEGLGDIRIFQNLFIGKSSSKIRSRTGWELSIAGILFLRGGSYDRSPNIKDPISTSGWGIDLSEAILTVSNVFSRPFPRYYPPNLTLVYANGKLSSDSLENGRRFKSITASLIL